MHIDGDEVDFRCWSNPLINTFTKEMDFGIDYSKLEGFYMQSLMEVLRKITRNGRKLTAKQISCLAGSLRQQCEAG